MKVAAVIPVAGSGKRFASKVPKQFQRIADRPVVAVTIQNLLSTHQIGQLVFAVSKENRIVMEDILQTFRSTSVIFNIVDGGQTRQDSVYNGLKVLKADTDVVLVHDGVRPLVSEKLIRESIEIASKHGACVPAIPVKDTIKRVSEGRVLETVPRENLWHVQTPQAFRYEILLEIHNHARAHCYNGTDESSLAEYCGVTVQVIPGEEANLKITTPEDLKLVRYYMEICP
jgi:2-C-methyl-D-erythritol 4-phosphate cytidylyltransferase